MERLDRNIGAVDAAPQQRPEVFQPVGVDPAVNVLFGVVDHVMGVFTLQAIVGQVTACTGLPAS